MAKMTDADRGQSLAFVIFSTGLQFIPLTNETPLKSVGHQMILIIQRSELLVLAG